MKGLTLDAGALIAVERGDRYVSTVIPRARESGLEIVVPAGVLGQVWRDGRRQVRLVRLLLEVEVEPLDERRARAAGSLCGKAGTRDVIDASVVLCARRRRHTVVTSDADDLLRLDPRLTIIEV